jgi:hypothetical protein
LQFSEQNTRWESLIALGVQWAHLLSMSDLRSEATITLTGIAPAGVFAFIAVQMVVSACIALTIGLSVQAPPALLLILLLAYAFAAPADSGALTSGMTMSASAPNKGATMALHATVASVCQLLAPGALASCSIWPVGQTTRRHGSRYSVCSVVRSCLDHLLCGGHERRPRGSGKRRSSEILIAPVLARTPARAREKSLKNFRLVPLRRRYVQRRRARAVIMPIMPTSELVWLVRR